MPIFSDCQFGEIRNALVDCLFADNTVSPTPPMPPGEYYLIDDSGAYLLDDSGARFIIHLS